MPEWHWYNGEMLWAVLVGRNDGEGYHVIFDADEGKFGLAHRGVCIAMPLNERSRG